MIHGSPAVADMCTELVGATEQWSARHHAGVVSDEHGDATLLVATEIGALALHDQQSGALGTGVLGPGGHLRLARAKVGCESEARKSAAAAREGGAMKTAARASTR